LCATEARRVRRRRRVAASLAQVLQREPAAHAVSPAIWSDATIALLVSRAVGQMAPAQREAFILFEVEGLTGKEVARLAGHSLPSTFRRLYEAQRLVRETLGIDRS
jgi:DNA-directed RNA polymerase specialized sigma24 family protein